MAIQTISIPDAGNNTFRVINSNSIEYMGNTYSDVSKITYPDGTVKTCEQLITEAGGATYGDDELKRCLKVEGYDKAEGANGRQVFTIYSNNSQQVGKNITAQIPGGAWIETFNFRGDADSNHILKIWQEYFASLDPPVDYVGLYQPEWMGFKINYGVSERRAYCVTKVNRFDEEGIASAPGEIDVTYMHFVQLSGLYIIKPPVMVGGLNHHYREIKEYRVYRSAVTSTGQVSLNLVPDAYLTYQPAEPSPTPGDLFNGAQPGVRHGWTMFDDVPNDALGEGLPSSTWDPPIYNECLGLTEWRNGMMVAYWKNTLKVFEPYRPFAQPRDYQITLPFNIVGLAVDDNALVVFTENAPYLVVGSHPTNITYEKMQNALGALAGPPDGSVNLPTRAMARTPVGLIYRTIDGPAVINGQAVRLIGRQLFTRDEWINTFHGSALGMRMAYLDARLFVYLSIAGDLPAFSYFMPIDDGDMTLTRLNLSGGFDFPIAHYDRKSVFSGATTLLYATAMSQPATAAAFNWTTEPRQPWSYRSRVNTLTKPESLTTFQVKASGVGPLRVRVRADGVTFADVTVTLANVGSIEQRFTHRIPTVRKAQHWSFELDDAIGGVTVHQVTLCSHPSELANA